MSKRQQGFAVMDPQLVAQLGRKGGKAGHRQGVAHEWTTDEARSAGRKGGLAVQAARRAREREEQEQT